MTLVISFAEKTAVPWADRVGVWTSALCLVHCLLTPVALSASAVLVRFLPSVEGMHRTLAVLIALIGAIALVCGFRRHRRMLVVGRMAGGLLCLWLDAFLGDRLPAHRIEVVVTMVRSGLISSHRLNHAFCRRCVCASC